LEGAREVGHIQETCRVAGGERQQRRQGIEPADACQLAHVALDQRLDVIAVPSRPAASRRSGERCGVAAGQNPLSQLSPKSLILASLESRSK